MRTPSRASISVRRRAIVQLRRSATGSSSKGMATRKAASLFTGGGPVGMLAFSAATPPAVKSLRHRRTVSSRTPNASAISGLVQPVSVKSTARARSASPRSREPARAKRAAGVVTRTLACIRLSGKMAYDDLVCPPSFPACGHPARRLAVYAFHAQLSRRRRSASGARFGYLLRNGAPMGIEVRAVVRQRTSPSTPTANIALASRRECAAYAPAAMEVRRCIEDEGGPLGADHQG